MNNKTWEELSRLEMHDQESSGCSVCLAEMMGGKNMEILREYISTLLSKERNEIIDKINERKEEVRRTEGAFKYDWCFEDCIKIIKKHNN